MPLAVTITGTEFTGNGLHVYGTIKATGNYPALGDVLNLSGFDQIKTDVPPTQINIKSQKATTNVFQYSGIPGATLAACAMQVLTGAAAQSGLTELSAGAYPAGVTGDVIAFEAIFLGRNI